MRTREESGDDIAQLSLIMLDVGGVFRDSSEAISEGYKRCFESLKLDYGLKTEDVWHLIGVGKYGSMAVALKAIVAVSRTNVNLSEIMKKTDPEPALDELVRNNIKSSEGQMLSSLMDRVFWPYWESDDAKSKITVFPFAKEAVQNFKNSRYTVGIFTNASRATVKRDLAPIGLENFTYIVTEEDVQNKKPDGEGIKRPIQDMGLQPHEAMYIGDSAIDVSAARDAGCISTVVLTGMGTRNYLETREPDFMFNNLLDASKFFQRA
ncbi:MAG: HAD family hydrolase [Candidatus Micrarchaeales archaeon]